jgi:hypothetical protein
MLTTEQIVWLQKNKESRWFRRPGKRHTSAGREPDDVGGRSVPAKYNSTQEWRRSGQRAVPGCDYVVAQKVTVGPLV